MIARLRGTLVECDGAVALIEAAGVGYEVNIPQSVMASLPAVGEEAILLTRQIIREDSVTLYGFLTAFQRRLFDLLLGVKGCGPKVALSLLGTVGEEGIVQAVSLEDARALARAPGVGPRLGERVILEIKDKVLEEDAARRYESATRPARAPAPTDELVDALIALGYRRNEAESAAATARDQADTLPDQIRVATQSLRK
ncbi:MAG: Holliday junction branch migration protein RuvA [Fimbriimonadaceae bacterium]